MGSAARQAELWGARVQDWAEVAEAQTKPVKEAVLGALALRAGTRLLDVGCGAGLFASMAVAAGAEVSGLDAAPAMIEWARRRAPAADLRVGDLEALPWADGTFDVVTGMAAFQFAADPRAALQEARRVVRRGGTVAIATWGRPEDCQASAFIGALRKLLPPVPGGAFAHSDEPGLQALVASAGLDPGPLTDVDCPFVYPDDATALRGILASAPGTAAIRAVGEAAAGAAVLGALAPFRTAEGGYRLRNKFRYLLAR